MSTVWVVVQCTYAPTLVHKWHKWYGTLNQHSSLNHYISLNQQSFSFGAVHLCTILGQCPYVPTLVHKWHSTLNQHSSLNHYISSQTINQHSFGSGAMHLCTNFGAMPICMNFGAQMAWFI